MSQTGSRRGRYLKSTHCRVREGVQGGEVKIARGVGCKKGWDCKTGRVQEGRRQLGDRESRASAVVATDTVHDGRSQKCRLR